jgi:hypothetical protein
MRIVIEHDTVNTTLTTSSAPPVEIAAENGGRALDNVGTRDQTAAENVGGPPQWLLDAVKQAMEEEQSASGATTDALDGGAAST